MDSLELALQALRLSDEPNISATAKAYNVDRSTLSRRFNGATQTAAVARQKRQLLHPQQEQDLIKYINKLTDKGIPPTTAMVRNFAEQFAGSRPGNSWTQRFVKRHSNDLDKGYLATFEAQRKGADSKKEYEYYFDLIKRKIEEHGILQSNTYNMDEKGISLGSMSKHHRIFNKGAVAKGRVIGAAEPTNREWITILATICADGTWIPPGIIFAGKTGNLQTSWVDNVEYGLHEASFASSPNGWTNDHLGLKWLEQVFDKYTKKKASYSREWRLLIVDGHGSHINMNFLDWCEQHHIFVAVYPPHTTHRLQPLDVSLFSPLATYYSQSLERFVHQTSGLSTIGKRHFFDLFWPAFEQAFTLKNIASGWSKTGLFPWNPDVVLSKLPEASKPEPAACNDQNSRPSSKGSISSTALSSISVQGIRQLVLDVAKEANSTRVRKLENTIHHLQNVIKLQEVEINNLKATLKHEKTLHKRGKGLFEQLRANDGYGAQFYSPRKIQQARDLQIEREAQKQAEQASKQLNKEQRTQDKLYKQQLTAQKRQQRANQRQESAAAKALQKATKEIAKDTEQANKQLNNDIQSSTKKIKRQKQPSLAIIEPPILFESTTNSGPSNPASTRPKRERAAPRYLNDFKLDI